MLDRLKPYHKDIYFLALALMTISLPLSRFGMSVAQFALLGNWLLEGKFKKKFNRLRYDIPALVLISFYLLHVFALIHTSDMNYALKDLRIKFPLFFLPFIIATTEALQKRKFHILLILYIAAVAGGSLYSFGLLITNDISDIREISPFISHIRFSLNLCLAIFISLYLFYSFQKEKAKIWPWIFVVIPVWLLTYLILSKSATGFYVLFTTGFLVGISILLKLKKSRQKNILTIVVIVVPIATFFYLFTIVQNYFSYDETELSNLEINTIDGNAYMHDTIHFPVENGKHIGLYICEYEMREAWNKISSFDFDGTDMASQELKFTLIRYLNSMGLRKDREAVESLNEWDIRNVEKGFANVIYAKRWSLKTRIYKLLWEYQVKKEGGNPGGHSLLQRLEFWKASIGIIKDNFWIGVGTGDIVKAFEKQYDEHQSYLAKEWRFRAHNQYLAIFVSFGVIGFIWFMFSLFYPALSSKNLHDYLYFAFFSILLLSMVYEDTLETQAGVTFYAFLNSLFLFARKK